LLREISTYEIKSNYLKIAVSNSPLTERARGGIILLRGIRTGEENKNLTIGETSSPPMERLGVVHFFQRRGIKKPE